MIIILWSPKMGEGRRSVSPLWLSQGFVCRTCVAGRVSDAVDAWCRLYWDLVMLVLLLANMITLPVAISFFNDDLSAHWIIFNGVCDTVFLTDLIINFRTGTCN